MASDLLHAKYDEMLDLIIDLGRKPVTVTDYFRTPDREDLCIIRHDVEWGCANSLIKAKLEARRGIQTTYYFHGPHRPKVFRPDEMRRFVELGHEVGYHYEVLDQTKGDFPAAREIFENEVGQFRDAGFDIKTVCAHGNPRQKKIGYASNYEILRCYPDLLSAEGLIAEASTSFYPTDRIFSVTDTGARIKAFKQGEHVSMDGSVQSLLAALPESEGYLLHILTHPDYWSSGRLRARALSFAGDALRIATRMLSGARSAIRPIGQPK